VDLHPEDLLDRARRGAASAEELARLRTHLAECHACRFEHVLADDCARAAGSEPGACAAKRPAPCARAAARAGTPPAADGGVRRASCSRRRRS
jgi:hypothetical protein